MHLTAPNQLGGLSGGLLAGFPNSLAKTVGFGAVGAHGSAIERKFSVFNFYSRIKNQGAKEVILAMNRQHQRNIAELVAEGDREKLKKYLEMSVSDFLSKLVEKI